MKNYKFRKSESNISPKLVERLQGGILLRFGIKAVTRTDENNTKTTVFEYDEFWFDPATANMADIVKSKGYELTIDYLDLLK